MTKATATETCAEMFERMVRPETVPNGQAWARRHNRAVSVEPIVDVCRSIARLCDDHERRNGSVIGADFYAAPLVLDMMRGAVGMLSMDIGGLDAGTMDGAIRAMATRAGLDGDTL